MTHPHRIAPYRPMDVAKGAFWGAVQATLSVGVPALLVWYFWGDKLPGAEVAPAPKSIEARINV